MNNRPHTMMTADAWLQAMDQAAQQDVTSRTGIVADMVRTAQEWKAACDDPDKSTDSIGAAYDRAEGEWVRLMQQWEVEYGRPWPRSLDELTRLATECGLPAGPLLSDECDPLLAMAAIEGELLRQKSLTDGGADGDEAYVSASALWPDRFGTYRKFSAWLGKQPESAIRRRKPSPQRLEIHAGDWARYWSAKDVETFETMDDGEIADAAARERQKRGE